MQKVEPKTLPGFMELLPQEQIKFNDIIQRIKASFEKFGFLPLDTPIIESADVLLAKAGGETEKQVYNFNKGENELCLRFDLTVPLAKFVAANFNQLTFPFKRYQIGKVFRGERPQKGRFREFYQCDIDVIGNENLSIVNDAEMPSIIYQTFKSLNIGDFVINFSNRKLLKGLFSSLELEEKSADILRTIDKLEKIGEEKVFLILIEDFKLSKKQVKTILDFVKISGTTDEKLEKIKQMPVKNQIYLDGVNEIFETVKYLRSFNVPDDNFEINLTITRGLDYYTGTVYETFLKDYRSIGSVCSGGRYDNLAEFYTDKKLPGVGISIGFTRLFYILNENEILKTESNSISKVIILPMTENIAYCLSLATFFRNNEINTEVFLEQAKFKNKLSYANKLQIPYAVIVGEDEIKQNYLTLKNMTTGEQFKLSKEEVLKKLTKN